jgi:hypothetical protein
VQQGSGGLQGGGGLLCGGMLCGYDMKGGGGIAKKGKTTLF